ncbi:hypothetical protein B4135_1697 [Caldibacillus debilis]|uniref:Uncharacterized protein n=1 Tax=Caldibacillus debilis TaxID=301148 RepID=A0A150M941_9BACI|nr:hypothetical protein B4135_1697 [Caldibacillus debilis]
MNRFHEWLTNGLADFGIGEFENSWHDMIDIALSKTLVNDMGNLLAMG